MRCAALVIALCTAGMTACAAVNRTVSRGESPADRLERGLNALRSQDFVAARNVLDSLYMGHWAESVGQRAALALVAAQMDTRNPNRQLWEAVDISARLLNVPTLEPWLVPVAETYYLVGLELGAQEQRLADSVWVVTDRVSGTTLPQSSRETVPSQLNRLRSDRDDARKQAEQLQQQLAARDKELRDTKQELERIKRTIKR